MAETMIERVARALCDTWAEREGCADYSWEVVKYAHQDPETHAKLARMYETAMAEARAAIEAMREPTVEMCIAVARADWIGKQDLNWGDGWRIMSDAALKETN